MPLPPEPNPDAPPTELPNPASAELDSLATVDIVRLMNQEDAVVVAAVAQQTEAIGAAVDAVAERLRQGGRLFYLGAGTSGRLGILDASECPPTFDTDPELVQGLIAGGEAAIRRAVEGAEDDLCQARVDLEARHLQPLDAVVGIAASGATPYVRGGLDFAQQIGCLTVAITCNPDTPIAAVADHPLELVVGPEILAGSTRLKAGTATKLVLNMLSTATMVRLGKTYGNLMVDLQASNAKLRLRALALLRRLTGVDAATAAGLMAECDGELKTCVVVQRLSLTPAAARARLAENHGRLRQALGESS